MKMSASPQMFPRSGGPGVMVARLTRAEPGPAILIPHPGPPIATHSALILINKVSPGARFLNMMDG